MPAETDLKLYILEELVCLVFYKILLDQVHALTIKLIVHML